MAVLVLVVAAMGASFTQTEVVRIQAHLQVVEGELEAADVSGLTEEQRGRRAVLIEELARYRNRGVFPRNIDFEDPTPYFIDDRGVRCAMAHLIEVADGRGIVQRVAVTANNAYVRELAGDGELVSWLEVNGLSLEEAARIQPSYPNAVGAWCATNDHCESGLCVPLDSNPEFSFCSSACDPEADDSCPTASPGGPAISGGAPMECAEAGDAHICEFSGPTMAFGDLCDPDEAPDCVGGCVWHEDGREDAAICTHRCTPSGDDCPDGYACLDAANIEFSWCFPVAESDGCRIGETGQRWTMPLLCLVAALGVVRRMRPARSAAVASAPK